VPLLFYRTVVRGVGVLLLAAVLFAALHSSAEAKTSRHRVWHTPHYVFHKYKTQKHGWRIQRVRQRKITYRHIMTRHVWLSKAGGKKHLKAGSWHYKRRHHKVRHRSSRGGSSAWVLPARVVMCESGGNPRVVNRTGAGAANGYPAGLYQIIGPTWRAYGGGRFASTADRASVWAQGVIAKRILAAQGTRAWACW
jgi:hypothetical protein